jgi:hypothetical protein
VDAFRADALSWNELPARGPEDQPPERLTTCWYEVEGYDPKVSYAVIQINHSKGNGDVVFIQPQSFRSRQSAVNWVTQVRVPEVARLMGKDSSDFTYAEATDADYEYSVYMNVKSTKQKVTFDIRRTEVQDDA